MFSSCVVLAIKTALASAIKPKKYIERKKKGNTKTDAALVA